MPSLAFIPTPTLEHSVLDWGSKSHTSRNERETAYAEWTPHTAHSNTLE